MKQAAAFLLFMLCIVLFSCAAAEKKLTYAFTGGDHEVLYDITYPDAQELTLSYVSRCESGSMQILSDGSGHFTGSVALPETYQYNNVYISLKNGQHTLLSKYAVQTAFVVTEPVEQAAEGRLKGLIVCIDPGHQTVGAGGQTEPLGPGLRGTQGKKGQAQGTATGRYEYIVNMEIAQRLRDAFLREGATVVMTKTSPEEFVSNVGRAEIANDAGAHIMLRLHCNSAANTSFTGISIHAPLNSDYAKAVADKDTYKSYCKALSDAMTAATGTKSKYACTDSFVASNWAKMPCFLIEMGFMSNRQEDILLSDPDYQDKLIAGMVEGAYQIAVMRGVLPAE